MKPVAPAMNREPRGPLAWMASNRVAANLLMLFFIIGGALTYLHITQEVFPDITEDMVDISVSYSGSSPEEVENGIILSIEEAINGVDGIDEIQSTATEGHASIRVTLLDRTDATKVYQDIKSEIDRITTLPGDAEEPVVSLASRRREVVSLVLYGSIPDDVLRELGEQVRAILLGTQGITQVDLEGVRDLETRIEISQSTLRKYGLTLQQVADVLAAAAVDVPGGGIKTSGGEILLRMKERRDYARQFARIPVISDDQGERVLLEDIADITDGLEDSDRFAMYNGMPSILLAVYRVGDQTPIAVADAALGKLDEIRSMLPDGVNIDVRNNRADIFRDRARLLLNNGVLGLILVFFLLGSFLELRLAFWVMMGIVVSFVGTLLLMPLADLSINMMTMFAFILALGIVVDDAIVVGENIYHRHENGMPFLQAAIHGAREVSVPVGFSILTNCVAFIPLYLLPGMMGRIMRMLPVVVIGTFLISWIECMFILPCHLGHHKDRPLTGIRRWIHERQQRFSGGFTRWVHRRYRPFLDYCLHHRYIVVVMACSILVITLSYVAGGHMGFQLMPTVESDYAYVSVVLPYGTPVERTQAVARQLTASAEAVVTDAQHPELVKGIFSNVGHNGSHTFDMRVFLADPEIRNEIMSTQQFVDRWREKTGRIAGVENMKFQSDRGGPGSGSALTVELRHRNVAVLEQASLYLASELEKFPRVKDVDYGFQQGKQQLDFKMLPQGERVGLTALSVARQVRNAYEGTEVLRQQRGRNEVKVKVYLPEEERTYENNLEQMILQTPSGTEIPLKDAVSITRGRAYVSIQRRNGERTMTVEADVSPRSAAGQVITVLDAETLPALKQRYPGLTCSYEGHQAEDRKSMSSMMTLIPAVLIGIYALLAIPFRSYIQPLIVMMSIPFGIVGAIWGHLIMGYSLSLIGIIGMLALSGVVVNDALVLIDFANNKRKEHDTAHDAVVAAGVQRFRPIMLTTLTTFCGLAPMIFETSRQARFLIPMALSLGFGLLFATTITLMLVPSLYMIVEDFRK